MRLWGGGASTIDLLVPLHKPLDGITTSVTEATDNKAITKPRNETDVQTEKEENKI